MCKPRSVLHGYVIFALPRGHVNAAWPLRDSVHGCMHGISRTVFSLWNEVLEVSLAGR
jgi:hypothetical protein